MSKIYEALQHAQSQKQLATVPTSLLKEELTHGDDFKDEMLSLYKMIEVLLPDTQSRIIQFVGSQEGEGTSTIVREFASVCAKQLGHSVLLLDADTHRQTQKNFYGIPEGYSWIEALKEGKQIESALHQIEGSKLFVSPSTNTGRPTPEVFNSPNFVNFCETLKAGFDFTLIDSAPFAKSPNLLAISSKIDGVVLVVEAEKTRWQTVRKLSETIDRVGGKVLGVVLNKRKFYIPKAIYKFL